MNYTQRLMEKAEPLIEELKKLKEVKVILFGGSLASGLGDKYSDIDLACFCTKIPDMKKREKILDRLEFKIKLRKQKLDAFWIGEKQAHIMFELIKDIETRVNVFLEKKFEFNEGDIKNFIIQTKVVYDKNKLFRKWKHRIGKYPKWLKDKRIERIASTGILDEVLVDVKRKKWFWIDKLLEQRLDWCVRAVYALNETYFSFYKWIEKESLKFRKKPNRFFERVQEIYYLRSRDSLIKKLAMLSDLMEDIFILVKKERPNIRFVYDYKQRKEKINEIKKMLEARK